MIIYLIEDLEFKKKFKGLSLYKVGHTSKYRPTERIFGLQNSSNTRLLYAYSYTKGEEGEDEFRESIIKSVNGFKCFSGWRYVDGMTSAINKDIRKFLEKRYLPPKGTDGSKFGGGLTEYFIGRDWETIYIYHKHNIKRYLVSNEGIEENNSIAEKKKYEQSLSHKIDMLAIRLGIYNKWRKIKYKLELKF